MRTVTMGEFIGAYERHQENVKTFNNYLDTLRAQVDDAHSAMIKADDLITAESLKNRFLGKDEHPKMLIEIFEDHNHRYEKLIGTGGSKGTLSRYRISLAHTQRFLQWRYHLKDIPVRKIDHQFVVDYDYWLRSERNCGNNSAVKYIRNFKKIVLICLDNGWIDRNPFMKYKGKTKREHRVCLEQSDLDRLMYKEFASSRLEQVRDIFLFSCFTGLAYVDVKKLHRNDHALRLYPSYAGILKFYSVLREIRGLFSYGAANCSLHRLLIFRNYRGKHVLITES